MFTLYSFAPLWLPYVDQQGNKISTLKKKERENMENLPAYRGGRNAALQFHGMMLSLSLGFHFMSI